MTSPSPDSITPKTDKCAFVAPSAEMFGAVSFDEGSSVWYNVVIRAEMSHVHIGENTNLQDFVMIHVGAETPTIVGRNCSITHRVTLHGATVGDDCLIGIGATLMDGAVIGAGSIVAGGTFVPEGKEYPPNSIIMGSPGKVRATRDNVAANRLNALLYRRNAEHYAQGLHRAWDGPEFEQWVSQQRRLLGIDTDPNQ